MSILSAILVVGFLALVIGLLLGYAQVRFHLEGDPLVAEIENLLPQTQCGQCGYPGCRPYAEALANKDEAINLCPPGGETTVAALADLLGKEVIPLDAPDADSSLPKVAFIREDECIGCTKCIQACPVDAILGAAKQMHTVIISECTGCDLCVQPCPVDCIDMLPLETSSPQAWQWPQPAGPFTAAAQRDLNLIATDALSNKTVLKTSP